MKAAASGCPHFPPNKDVAFWVKTNVGFPVFRFVVASAPERGCAVFSVNLKEATVVASPSRPVRGLSRSSVAGFGVCILVVFYYFFKKKY